MKKISVLISILLVITLPKLKAQGLPFCPNITATTTNVPLCGGSCATLAANVVAVNQTTTYSVQSIPYVPYSFTGGTAVSVGTDDVWSPVINLGFDFCFFGNSYNKCVLGSNGQLTFSTSLASGFDNWAISAAIPSTANMPGNTICAAFRDIDPSVGGTMKYYFTGTAPCRAMVIYWSNIPLYSPTCASTYSNSTFQLVLYENTNYIDVYIQNSTSCPNWNSGRGIIGIQNLNATVAYTPPNRNFPNTWTAVNEAWRFVPTGPQSYTVSWAGPSGPLGTGLTQTVCPSSTTTYTATMNVTSCMGVSSTYTSPVTVTVSPNPPPVVTASVTQMSCTSPTNAATAVITSGTPGYTVNWVPPATLTGSTATTYSVNTLATGLNTITVVDASGCSGSTTVNVTSIPALPTFSVNAPGGTVVGCAPSTLTLVAVNTSSLYSNMTYTWTSASTGSFVGNPWVGGAPLGTNVLTVTASDLTAGTCPVTLIYTITANTSVPGCTVAPLSRTLTCGSPCASFTATSSGTTNIVGVWLDQSNAIISGPSSTPLVMCTGNTGTYTAVFTNSVNGCTSSQTVSVVDNSGSVPTMSVTSNQNTFTLTCNNPQISMNINTTSTITPKTYSWTNVSTNVTTTPVSGGYTVTVPGQYIACLNSNSCVVCQTITISQDTIKPIVSSITNLPSSSYTLTCAHPVLTASAVTSPMLPITNYSWTTPPNLTVSQPTISVSLTNITSSTSPNTYTVLAMGANGCVGRQKVLIYKDVYVPPYTAVFTPSAITCAVPCVALSTGASTSTVPVTFTFTSPAPTQTANTNGFLFCNPGTYTMTYQNTLNGCTATTTTLVPLNVTLPSTVALSPVQIPCGQTTTVITAGFTGNPTANLYEWKGPIGAGMSCAACFSTSVNTPGIYAVTITNAVNGCSSTNTVLVTSGSLDVSMSANPTTGTAPLNVNFANTTPFTSTSGTMTTTWSYGNGLTATTTSAASVYSANTTPYPSGSTVYPSSGTYTVFLSMSQQTGTSTCVGTASAVVSVDNPSALVIPNVFTPNSDGVNDYFTLRTTNLIEITCTIYDNWGVKMYDVKSETGNISWDGKNLTGKDVPEGTYFYIIKATGKDGKTEFLNDKGEKVSAVGTVSLYR